MANDKAQRPNISDIGPSADERPDQDDQMAKSEQIEKFSLPPISHLQRDRFKQETARIAAEHKLRLDLAKKILRVVVAWLVAIVALMIWQGVTKDEHRLSGNVIIATLSTTTINVLGLLLAVTRYLFPNSPIKAYETPRVKRK